MAKRVGIVGFGVVGKSVLKFLRQAVSIWDSRILSDAEQLLLARYHAQNVSHLITIKEFFLLHDIVIVSPGFDVRPYAQYRHKMRNELDLFAPVFCKQTVAITGTLGKTTVTKLLNYLLPKKSACGGNVGIAMLDLVCKQEETDMAVLELSSFQLNHNTSFAPDVAIWTNMYPNHLDWHGGQKAYAQAKSNLFVHQTEQQYALYPIECAHLVAHTRAQRCVIFDRAPMQEEVSRMSGARIFYVEHGEVCTAQVRDGLMHEREQLCMCVQLPGYTFMQNWLFVIATLYVRGVTVVDVIRRFADAQSVLDDHRIEHFATLNGIDFYNDSKATVMQATQAAIQALAQRGRSIILIIGGLNKGADRTPLVDFIAQTRQIKKVLCLGTEIPEFSGYASYSSLRLLAHAIMQTARAGDCVLFSPSGSSFDLFDNYIHRGDSFKKEIYEAYQYTAP